MSTKVKPERNENQREGGRGREGEREREIDYDVHKLVVDFQQAEMEEKTQKTDQKRRKLQSRKPAEMVEDCIQNEKRQGDVGTRRWSLIFQDHHFQ